MNWAVRIEGKYSTLVVWYEFYDDACAGAERARRKVAFVTSNIEVING